MPLLSAWKFAPAPWLTGFDRATLDTVLTADLHDAEKMTFENPAFSGIIRLSGLHLRKNGINYCFDCF